MIQKFCVPILSAIILMLSTAAVQGQKPAASPTPSPTPLKLERVTKFDGNVTFPEVDGWELSEKTQYPTPDMGYSVNYESPAARITIYVYTGGQSAIPNSLLGVVAEEMKGTQAGINTIVERGGYESAKELKNETVTLGGKNGKVKSLHVHYDLRAGGRDLDSHIYLFPYNNYFVKLRMTGPKAATPNAGIATLLEAIDLLFSK